MGADASEIRHVTARLERATSDMRRRGNQALRKAAEDTKNSAKNKVPVDTGNLKGSIGVTMVSDLQAEIGPTAEYGFWVEMGTSRMAPQPYMGPAADIHFPLFEQAIAQLGEELLSG